MRFVVRGEVSLAAVVVFLVLCSTVTAYYMAFSGMASYDDEGTLISWIRDALSGQPLYDGVQAPYGPLYFAYEWLAHAPFGIPVSNDSVRFVTVFFWVTAVLLVFLLSYKMTGSAMVSLGASFLAFRELRFLANNPAHPQELCIVLLVGLALTACFTGDRTRLILLMGVIAAAMTLTKINLGILAIAALGVAFVYSTKNTQLWTAARVLVTLVALIVPAGLMSGLYGQPWVLRFCALETVSLAAALLVLSRFQSDVKLRIREFVAAALGFVASLMLISSFALVRGSSLAAMIDCLILIPRKSFGPLFFIAAPISMLAIPWAIVCLLLAWVAATRRLNADIIGLLKLGLAAIVVFCCVTHHYAWLMSFTPCLLWLIATPTDGAIANSAGGFARAVLLLVTVFQLLYAFPVAGTQVWFTEICTISVAAVCLADALRYMKVRLPHALIPPRRQMFSVAVSALMVSIYCFTAWRAMRLYDSRSPLNLPGATRIHLNFETTRALREIVRLVRVDFCSTLITWPGMLSFNIWTGVHSPSALGGGRWVTLSDAAQESVARQLSNDLHTCVIIDTDINDLWAADAGGFSRPMARFIRDNFRNEFEGGTYKFLVRR
jgi:hypothetical protein